MIKGIIFDMDGVLLDTAKYHFESWQFLSKSLGFHLDEKVGEQLKGINRSDSLDIVLNIGGISGDGNQRNQWMEIKNQQFLDSLPYSAEAIILGGVTDLLQDAKANNIPMAVASSSKNAHYILKKTGLDKWFISILDATNILRSKPNPEVFLNSARELQLLENECLVLEDSYKGIDAAIQGGFPSIGIGDKDVLSSADVVIQNLEKMTISKLFSLIS